MHVELYERIWMWAATGLLVLFLASIIVVPGTQAVHPPSHLETIDPAKLAADPEFGHPGVKIQPDGRAVVSITFANPGEYLIACNEYCGLAHHSMVGKLIVKREAK